MLPLQATQMQGLHTAQFANHGKQGHSGFLISQFKQSRRVKQTQGDGLDRSKYIMHTQQKISLGVVRIASNYHLNLIFRDTKN
jgi:hypothetical protein